MKTKTAKSALLSFLLCFSFYSQVSRSAETEPFSLAGTQWEKAATKHKLDPYLLYSVALAESASGRGDIDNKMISPWPWTLRTLSDRFYGMSKSEALSRMENMAEKSGEYIDVGLMQVSYYWHKDKVNSIEELLDPQTNLDVGAQVLKTAMRSAPNDLELGVGRYHNWKDQDLARNFGSRVIAIWKNIKAGNIN